MKIYFLKITKIFLRRMYIVHNPGCDVLERMCLQDNCWCWGMWCSGGVMVATGYQSPLSSVSASTAPGHPSTPAPLTSDIDQLTLHCAQWHTPHTTRHQENQAADTNNMILILVTLSASDERQSVESDSLVWRQVLVIGSVRCWTCALNSFVMGYIPWDLIFTPINQTTSRF